MAKKSADAWFAEYGESHQDHTNELIHWICVPVIFACVLGFVRLIPVPATWGVLAPWFNWALPVMLVVWLFYLRLSPALSVGMLLFMVVCYAALILIRRSARWPLGQICAFAFVVAWIGQFVGHQIEGRKPSFFKDVVFLLIGPAWLMSFVYKRLGLRY